MIRLTVPSLDESDFQAVRAVLETGFLVQGAQVHAFEQALEPVTGAKHVIAVANGTAALHLALLSLDVRPADIVLVTAYSWISTANAIEFCGAQPVFVDIDPGTFNLDPACLEVRLEALMGRAETARRVKAILPIDAFGQIACLPEILNIANRYGIPVVEDAACSLGASHHGRPAGSEPALATFSLHPRKAITTGEGGMITTQDDNLAAQLRALRNHGLNPDSPTPDFIRPGYNYRLTEFQAALGLSQLRKMPRILAARRALAARYSSALAGTAITPPAVANGGDPVFQSYVCLLPEQAAARRPNLIASLKQAGIETTIGTWHMPLTTYYRNRYGYRLGDFPNTDLVFSRALSLPLYESLQHSQQDFVVETLLGLL
jgi:perosamine synthetase